MLCSWSWSPLFSTKKLLRTRWPLALLASSRFELLSLFEDLNGILFVYADAWLDDCKLFMFELFACCGENSLCL